MAVLGLGLTMSAVLALGIGLSRAYLGVHRTTDVAAGWLLGGALLALAGATAVVEVGVPEIHRSEGVPAPPLR